MSRSGLRRSKARVRARERAVVVGASMAGLLAARVLAESFDEVIVLDRDNLPAVADYRRGVPHGRQPHAVLMRGKDILTELLPGLGEELLADGAVTVTASRQMRFVTPRGALRQDAYIADNLAMPRPLLEHRVRARVLTMANVTVRPMVSVGGVVDDGAGGVVGVRLFDKGTEASSDLDADLVVDASGRTSQAPSWLDALGFPAPAEDSVRTDLGYVTAKVRMEEPSSDRVVVVAAKPGRPVGCGMGMIGPETWLVALYGYGEHRPSAEPDQFLPQLAAVARPDVLAAFEASEPVDDRLRPYRVPAVVWRRYDRARRLPAGLLVLGDAVASFNPIYGQGMTVAAQEALDLRYWLEEGSDDPARFQRRAAKIVRQAWDLSTGADLSLPEVPGRRPLTTRLLNPYLDQVQAAGAADPDVAKAFFRVAGMLDHPSRMLRPTVVAKVAGHGMRRRFRAGGDAAQGLPYPDPDLA